MASPEAKILRKLRDEIKPHFGFNLHDQNTTWSAGKLGNPATISLLAPAFDDALTVDTIRQIAMQVIAEMNDTLQELIPGHVGRWDDEFESRAFGDNFQAAGTSTILIESGGYGDDHEKQYIRKLVFVSIIAGLISISERTYIRKTVSDYFTIPQNKSHHFQMLLRNCKLERNGQTYTADIGLHLTESVNEDLKSVSKSYSIGDIGDLSNRFGYKELDSSTYTLIKTGELKFEEPADFVLMDGVNVLLEVEKGVLTTETL